MASLRLPKVGEKIRQINASDYYTITEIRLSENKVYANHSSGMEHCLFSYIIDSDHISADSEYWEYIPESTERSTPKDTTPPPPEPKTVPNFPITCLREYYGIECSCQKCRLNGYFNLQNSNSNMFGYSTKELEKTDG